MWCENCEEIDWCVGVVCVWGCGCVEVLFLDVWKCVGDDEGWWWCVWCGVYVLGVLWRWECVRIRGVGVGCVCV